MKKLKPKEPKASSIIITAFTGIFLGGALGVSLLLSKPVNVVSKMPDADAPGSLGDYTTHFVVGRKAAAETTNLRSGIARIQRRTPGPVSFSEDEINYYLGKLKPKEEENAADKSAGAGTRLEQFNVRIVGDVMIASVKIIIDPTGDRFEMLAQAEVGFENTDDGPQLLVKSLRVNSLPVPTFGGMVGSMIQSKLTETEWPEEYIEMWENIRNIELESGKLITEVGIRRAT